VNRANWTTKQWLDWYEETTGGAASAQEQATEVQVQGQQAALQEQDQEAATPQASGGWMSKFIKHGGVLGH